MNQITTAGTDPHGATPDNGLEYRIKDSKDVNIRQNHIREDLGDLDLLAGSIRRNGLQEPLHLNQTGDGQLFVIDGVRRLKAAQLIGMESIPCLVHIGLSEVEVAHLFFLLNHERKTLNPIEEANQVKTMRDDHGLTLDELELMGYGSRSAISEKLKLLEMSEKVQRMVRSGIITPSHAKAINKLPSVEEQDRMAKRVVDFDLTVRVTNDRIDRYLAKKRKAKKSRPKEIVPSDHLPGVYFKDSSDMVELPDKSVHLIVSSPPYFRGKEYEIGMSFKEHLANVRGVMQESSRVLDNGGIIALNLSDIPDFRGNSGISEQPQWQLMGHRYQSYFRRYGVLLTDVLIWEKRPAWSRNMRPRYKENTEHTSYRVFDNWEPIYIFRKKGNRELPSEDIILKSKLTSEQWIAYVNGVWKIEPVKDTQEHPCIYPDELVKRLVQMFSYVGDTVLDPFLGSGTTVKVARELGREGIGYERELKYKPVIMKKLGIEPEASEDSPSESMAEYAERSLDDHAPTDETATEKEPFFYSKESEEETAEPEMST